MIGTLVVVTSLVSLVFGAYLVARATGEPIWRVNMLSFGYYTLVAFAFVASVVVVLQVPVLAFDPVHAESYTGGAGRRIAVWGATMWMLVGFGVGAVVVEALVRRPVPGQAPATMRGRQWNVGLGLGEAGLFRVLVIASALSVAYNAYFLPDRTALTVLLSNGLSGAGSLVVDAQVARRAASFGPANVVASLLFNVNTLSVLSCIAFGMAYRTRRWRWTLLFASTGAAAAFLALSTGGITRIVLYVVMLAFMRSQLGGPFFRVREMGVLLAGVAGLFVLFKGVSGNIAEVVLRDVSSRVFFSQMIGTYYAMEVFPSLHPFLGFSSTGRLIHEFLNLPYSESYGIILMQFYNWQGVVAGSAGHLTTVFLGEAWANFGTLGLVIAPLWVGGVVHLLHRTMVRRAASLVWLAIYAQIATTLGYARDFEGFYYPLGTVSLIVGVMLLLHGLAFLVARYGPADSAIARSIVPGSPHPDTSP